MPPSLSLTKTLLGPDNLVQGLTQIPSAAMVLPALLEVLNSATSSLDEVVAILKLDAGVASRLLNVANSAFYNRGVRCEALDEAVHKVGFLRVYELVSITAANKLILQPLTAYGLPAEEMWKRSVTAAIGAEIVAERTGLDRQLAYTAGLLHGIGLIVIDRWAQGQDPHPLIASQGYPKETVASEMSILGFTNASAAGALLRSWGFPDNLVDPIRWQYDPRATAARNQPVACVLSIARWLRDVAHLEEGQAAPAEPERWIMQALRLSAGELAELACATRMKFYHVVELLKEAQKPDAAVRAHAAQQ